MQTHKQGGFTIIEVVIFLAITGLMLSVALAGTGSAIRSVRFTDSVRSFESYMQRQYDETLNGVNPRTGAETCHNSKVELPPSLAGTHPGTSDTCLLLGKYLYFTEGSSEVKTYYVVGTEPAATPESVKAGWDDLEAIEKVSPHVVANTNVSTYEIPWGAFVAGTNSGSKKIDSIAILRSPRSSNVYIYAFQSGAEPTAFTADFSDKVNVGSVAVNRQTNICVQSQDNFPVYGAVTFAKGGRGQDAIGFRADIGEAEFNTLCQGSL